ncbi:MAG: glycosyltransferase [Bacteroidota bacterium]
MKIYYFSPYDILRPRTNQVGDMRLCEGFVQNGAKVDLIIPFVYRKDNIPREKIWEFYGLEDHFNIRFLKTWFTSDVAGKWMFSILSLLNCMVFTGIIIRSWFSKEKVYIISRTPMLLRPFLWIRMIIPFACGKIRIVSWIHELKLSSAYRFVYKNADGVMGTNSSLTNDLIKETGKKKEKTCVTLNPISSAQLRDRPTKSESRKEIGLNGIYPLIVYTGKIGTKYNKEIIYILEAAEQLPDYHFLFTGGKQDAISILEEWCDKHNVKNVKFTGYIPDYTRIKYYQSAADILISYYTSQGHDVRYNFPNKLCEYMLTGNVAITPDFPANRDVAHKDNVLFTDAENSVALAATIRKAAENPELSKELAARALTEMQEMTFKVRCSIIINFLKTL